MARRQFLLLAGLAASFLLLLALCLRATGSWRTAFLMGAIGAAEQTVGPSFFDKMTDAIVPAAAGAGQGAAGGLAAPSSSLPPSEPSSIVPCGKEGCGDVGALPAEDGAGAGEETASADTAASEEEAKLELIKMKDRARGESRMYGGGDGSAQRRTESQPAVSLEASFEGMIHKLKGRASAQAAAGGGGSGAASLGGGSGGRSGGGDGGGDGGAGSPVLTRNGKIDPRYDSPTLRALQKVNANSAHSYSMTSDPGLEDGSKDHAGKSFDGNKNTFTDIPISVKKGAMGQKQIIIAPEEP